ncbi:hypothetical protein KQX54_005521 [Cotesia glomerata]|uniref:Uncharacterized protein n=1 Tax=Cotesia glomerata TaxID=32391 RepID=A0AAV7HT72_COTGL|nr:hypothetical protein KQX54_005521 [Cotesia glomerata]
MAPFCARRLHYLSKCIYKHPLASLVRQYHYAIFGLSYGPVGEVGGVRLPLQSLHGYGSVFMYSASTSPGGTAGQGGGGGGEVTLRLREPEDIPEEVLARLEDTATLSISLQGDAVLRLGSATTASRYDAYTRVRSRRKEYAKVSEKFYSPRAILVISWTLRGSSWKRDRKKLKLLEKEWERKIEAFLQSRKQSQSRFRRTG